MEVVQLSLNVEPHPELKNVTDGGVLTSTLKVSLDVHLPRDLQPGDVLHAAISDADGQVIAVTDAEVVHVGFSPIKDDGAVIGTERQHKAKQA